MEWQTAEVIAGQFQAQVLLQQKLETLREAGRRLARLTNVP